jgi:hypothetical protein
MVALARQIESVRALRRQPAIVSVNARRHLDFSDHSRKRNGWAVQGGSSYLLTIRVFMTKKF